MDKYQTLREKDNPSNNVYPNIQTQNIPDGAIITAKLADGAVSTDKLVNYSISTDKIINASVTNAKLADGAVTSAKLSSNSVSTNKIIPLAVDSSCLATNSVTTAKIVNNAVKTGKLDDEAVTMVKLAVYRNTIADYLTDVPQTLNNFATAISNLVKGIDGLLIACFISSDMTTNEFKNVFFEVDSQNTITWRISDDMTLSYDIVDDAGVATFMQGDATSIYIVVVK